MRPVACLLMRQDQTYWFSDLFVRVMSLPYQLARDRLPLRASTGMKPSTRISVSESAGFARYHRPCVYALCSITGYTITTTQASG